jgi:two-component system, OmpR family, sensor histidine kinase KdpD
MATYDLRWLAPTHGPTRILLVSVAGPCLVSCLAFVDGAPKTLAALLYVLAVVLAAALGGVAGGIGASLLSFLALNFFFTSPLHTFAVGSPSDLVGLVVFLVVAVVVGVLLSTALSAKSRAEERERESRALNEVATRLLSGGGTETVLRRFARTVVELLDLARCEIRTDITDEVVVENDRSALDAQAHEVAIMVTGSQIGTMRLTPAATRGELAYGERELVRAFAAQLALYLDSARLGAKVRRAELDAETSRLKTVVISGVTHDLKTPLAAITACATSLLDGSEFTKEEQRDHLDTIMQEAHRLHRLVNNLLELSRLRAGELVPAKVATSIDELIEGVVHRLQPLLDGREVELRLRERLPEVELDVGQIDQVLTNLIENAVKFSPLGSPIVIAAVGDARGVRVTVEDRGSGIARSERGRLFEPFKTGGGEGSGTGLGLAIAKAIVAAHGGSMWARDALGGGAAVTFELPCGNGSVLPGR